MSFSYTAGSTATLDRVRLEIGDTDEDRALFQDAELDDIIVVETDVLPSAARACEILATRYAREVDFSADGSSFSKSQASRAYLELAKRLRARARGTSTVQAKRKDAYSDDIKSHETQSLTSGRIDRRLDW